MVGRTTLWSPCSPPVRRRSPGRCNRGAGPAVPGVAAWPSRRRRFNANEVQARPVCLRATLDPTSIRHQPCEGDTNVERPRRRRVRTAPCRRSGSSGPSKATVMVAVGPWRCLARGVQVGEAGRYAGQGDLAASGRFEPYSPSSRPVWHPSGEADRVRGLRHRTLLTSEVSEVGERSPPLARIPSVVVCPSARAVRDGVDRIRRGTCHSSRSEGVPASQCTMPVC